MFYKESIVISLLTFVKCSVAISLKNSNNITEDSWNLSSTAIQSRQNFKYDDPHLQSNVINGNYQYEYPNYQNYQALKYQKHPVYAKPYLYRPIPQNTYFQPSQNPYLHQSYPQFEQNPDIRKTIMDVLFSVARNDDLQCVPKILCEMTSGTMYGRQNGFNLPININLESLIGLLSSLNGLESSPLFYFGKAALLGYSSKDNTRSCTTAYPDCPSDPEKLIQYLNNHNGGFFRYFKGISLQNYAPYYQHYKPSHYQNNLYYEQPYLKQKAAQQRIQNRPVTYILNNNLEGSKEITFPQEHMRRPKYFNGLNVKDIFSYRRPSESLKFPSTEEGYTEGIHRRPKVISDGISYNKNIRYYEKPSSGHKASPMIFPDRTGTGELIVDSAEFDKTNVAFEDDDIRIKYNDYRGDENVNVISNNYYRFKNGRGGFSFPDP